MLIGGIDVARAPRSHTIPYATCVSTGEVSRVEHGHAFTLDLCLLLGVTARKTGVASTIDSMTAVATPDAVSARTTQRR